MNIPMKNRLRSSRAAGFTLLVTLLALAMVITLLFVMTRVFDDLVDARRRIERSASVVEGATSALELLARSADTVVASSDSGGAGVVGDATSLQITRSGIATSRLSRAGSDVSPLFDKHAIEMAFRNGGFEVKDGDGGDWSTLVPEVFAVRFRYHDGASWTEAWNSGDSGLPVAIECAIWTAPWPDDLRPAWIPDAEDDEAFAVDSEDFFSDDAIASEFGSDADDPFFASATFLTADDPMPRPDHVRVVAILDAIPGSGSRDEDGDRR